MADPKDEVPDDIIKDMEGMASVEHDEFVDTDDDFEDDTGLTSSLAELVRTRYNTAGTPNWNDFHVTPPPTIADYEARGHEVRNDIYLTFVKPDPAIAAVNQVHANTYRDYEVVSGYESKRSDWHSHVKQRGPRLADSGGGKGITSITRSVTMQGVGMSGLLNITLATGCSATCNFCLESLTGHTYSEADISEAESGEIRMSYTVDDERLTYVGPGKTKVGAWDVENEIVIYMPLQTALAAQFPILKQSLRLISNEYGRATRRNISD